MFFKILSTFLAIQFVLFAVWQGVQQGTQKVSANSLHAMATQAPLHHVHFAKKDEFNQMQSVSEVQKNEIKQFLGKLPVKHLSALKHLILDYNPKAHRGLGGADLIILRAVNISREEFFAVLIHEIGHSVDLGVVRENHRDFISPFKDGNHQIYETDSSLEFYRISWENEHERKKTAVNADFVSGYAMSDPFEDFAETYAYYLLHNQTFKSKAQTSEALLEKYYYMKNRVFDGKEFSTGELIKESLNNRPWDITKLPYSVNHITFN